MSSSRRFLELAALELIQTAGVRLIKGPGFHGQLPDIVGGMPDWDQILIGDGAGVPPAVYAFTRADGLELSGIENMFEALVERVTAAQVQRRPGFGPGVKLVAIFYFNAINPTTAKRITRLAPKRFHEGLKPEVWVADLSAPRLYAPRGPLSLLPSNAERAVKRALEAAAEGIEVDPSELVYAQNTNETQRARFVSAMRQNVPYVTYALLAAIWIVFLLEYFARGGSFNNDVLLEFGAMQPVLIQKGEVWLLFTTMFVHVGWLHIGSNSIALYSIGTIVERIYGHVRYAFIYLASGLFASVASYLFMLARGDTNNIAAGASGAIFGIAGVVIALGVRKDSVVPRAVAVQLSVFMLVLIAVNIVYDTFTPQIDITAHVGGLALGFILGYLLAPTNQSPGSRKSPQKERELLR
jgi:rhomboid protease GluP